MRGDANWLAVTPDDRVRLDDVSDEPIDRRWAPGEWPDADK